MVDAEPRQLTGSAGGWGNLLPPPPHAWHRDEAELSKAVCASVSEAYRRRVPAYLGANINFGSLEHGSKTLAQLSAVINLREVADYVTLLDDDTLVPPTWSAREIACASLGARACRATGRADGQRGRVRPRVGADARHRSLCP